LQPEFERESAGAHVVLVLSQTTAPRPVAARTASYGNRAEGQPTLVGELLA
jgi:hypothetical protein